MRPLPELAGLWSIGPSRIEGSQVAGIRGVRAWARVAAPGAAGSSGSRRCQDVLGAGERLFDGVPPLRLEQVSGRSASLVTHITYRLHPVSE